MPGAVLDVITLANFCEDRLRGFGVAKGQILAFCIIIIIIIVQRVQYKQTNNTVQKR